MDEIIPNKRVKIENIFHILPLEIVYHILSYLKDEHLSNLLLTSVEWYYLIAAYIKCRISADIANSYLKKERYVYNADVYIRDNNMLQLKVFASGYAFNFGTHIGMMQNLWDHIMESSCMYDNMKALRISIKHGADNWNNSFLRLCEKTNIV